VAAGADIVVISPSATPSVEAMADAGELRWERRAYREGDLAEAWYVLIATKDAQANAAASAEAEDRRVWCVRSDDADAATAWTPATGRSEGVTVAVLTGRDPRRSAAVRDAIVEGLRDGTLAAPHHRTRTAGVALVGGGPGDPDLITVRGRRLLAEADVVIADRLGPRDLLDELAPHVEVIDAAKIPYGRAMAQEAINNALIEHAKAGKAVVRLKGGDPFVFGRGMEEAEALAEAGIPCTVVPGISSSISVPGAAGIPVTHRGVAHEFTVVSGHVAPEDPRSLVDWTALAKLRGTLVLLMAVERIGAIAATLIEHGRTPDTPVAVIQEGTTAAQRRVDGTLATVAQVVADEGIRPPAVIVIGDVVTVGAGKGPRA
jgi:uroporphyrin-III C-methyltransferase/precorrin-2 dehydrogenase/sirohydrochlorin ferrochelatase